ncbi:recombinase family protein [Pararhizobium sp. IMCC21322]|uniref:recombinase family protein n=1 Tax=Pararhizobium sp. IMCC21322 TaxID=3067903 RepID=UPI002740B561|nr:recombinase family protein [Pararhizobium sp. IMCC21322]
MTKIGYARVSTTDQDLDLQQNKLKAEGYEIIRSAKVSGATRAGREELQTIIEFLRTGDELMVTHLDHLGRDTRAVLNIIHDCEQRGAFVTILGPHVSTRGEMVHMVLTVLGMVAPMERRFIKVRQREGIQQAKANFIYKGGIRRIDRAMVL